MSKLAGKYESMLRGLRKDASGDDVLCLVKKIASMGNPTIDTKLVRYSHMKTFFKHNRPAWVKFAQPPFDLVDAVKVRREKTLFNRRTLFVKRDDLDQILGWANERDAFKRLAFLQLTSGRRVSELIECDFWGGPDKCSVTCAQLKKKRTIHGGSSFPIHAHCSPSLWLRKLEDVRSDLNGKKMNTITKAYNKVLKSATISKITSHKLRGMYANELWMQAGRVQNQTGFIQDVLCLEGQEVALHYANFVML